MNLQKSSVPVHNVHFIVYAPLTPTYGDRHRNSRVLFGLLFAGTKAYRTLNHRSSDRSMFCDLGCMFRRMPNMPAVALLGGEHLEGGHLKIRFCSEFRVGMNGDTISIKAPKECSKKFAATFQRKFLTRGNVFGIFF